MNEVRAIVPEGVYSIRNRETSEYRTYRVVHQPEGVAFAPGNVILSILRGANNSTDYLPVAFLTVWQDRLFVNIWKKHKGTEWERLAMAFAKIWVAPSPYQYEILKAVNCLRCGELLTNPESIEVGMGPICRNK